MTNVSDLLTKSSIESEIGFSFYRTHEDETALLIDAQVMFDFKNDIELNTAQEIMKNIEWPIPPDSYWSQQ